jgi:hypothetical protein
MKYKKLKFNKNNVKVNVIVQSDDNKNEIIPEGGYFDYIPPPFKKPKFVFKLITKVHSSVGKVEFTFK